MENRNITKFKWFWIWQDDAEERWLEQMSKKGFHLSSVSTPGFYTFTKDKPVDFVYRLDYQRFYKKDRKEYLQLFNDAGWEYLGEMSAWQYFRKQMKTGEINEIFTDMHSKIAKYRRIIGVLGFACFFLMSVLLERVLRMQVLPWWGNVQIFLLLVLLLVVYAIVRILLRIQRLKKTITD